MLENILKQFFNLNGSAFDANGELTTDGSVAYTKLESLISALSKADICDYNAIMTKLDAIVSGPNL